MEEPVDPVEALAQAEGALAEQRSAAAIAGYSAALKGFPGFGLGEKERVLRGCMRASRMAEESGEAYAALAGYNVVLAVLDTGLAADPRYRSVALGRRLGVAEQAAVMHAQQAAEARSRFGLAFADPAAEWRYFMGKEPAQWGEQELLGFGAVMLEGRAAHYRGLAEQYREAARAAGAASSGARAAMSPGAGRA